MKTIPRTVIFSALALYLTSLWDKGFVLKFEAVPFILTSIAVAILYYVIRPLTKIVLLPFNILTFGLVSLLVFCFLFYIITSQFSIVQIKDWVFPGLTLLGFHLPKMSISYLQNIALSSLSVSFIIGILERLI